MKLLATLFLGGIAVTVGAQTVEAQQPATRLGLTATIGTESGLGYRLPYTAFGTELERTIGDHFEIQAEGNYSPTHKVNLNNGHEVYLQGRGLAWLSSRVALTTGDNQSWNSTNEFTKSANSPEFGIAARFWWLGFPSRFYAAYLVPEGKRPTDGSLQSNREQGVATAIEAQGWKRVRLIFSFNVLTFLDQSGAAPGLRHWEGTVDATARFGTKQNMEQLY